MTNRNKQKHQNDNPAAGSGMSLDADGPSDAPPAVNESPTPPVTDSPAPPVNDSPATPAEEPKRYVRVSDENRPHCPRCSNAAKGAIVFLDSRGTDGPVTYYKCAGCGYSENKLRKTARQLLRLRSNPLDLSAR